MLIQNEYCNGGTLSDVIAENYRRLSYLSELELKDLLLQVTRGLKYIHSTSLVHMDIKPSEYQNVSDIMSQQWFLIKAADGRNETSVNSHVVFDQMEFWSETNSVVFVQGNIFISRKSVASFDECDEDDGLTTSAVYKIGKQLLQSSLHLSLHLPCTHGKMDALLSKGSVLVL